MRRCATLALLAIGLSGSAGVAQSPTGPGPGLSWNAPEECPDVSTVLARVRAHDPAASTGRTDVRVHADITRANGRYRLALRVEDRAAVAERALDGDDCSALADAAALLIALTLTRGEDATGARSATKPLGEPDHRAPVAPAAAPEPAPDQLPGTGGRAAASAEPPPGAAQRAHAPAITVAPDNEVLARSARPLALRFAFGAALGLDAGMLPRAPAVGLELLLALQVARWRAQLALSLWLARSGDSERYARAQLSGSGTVGKLSLGVDLLQAPLVFGPRGVLELGRLAVETRGVSEPQQGGATWFAAGPALHLGYPAARRLALALELGVLFPFARPRWLLRTPDGTVDLFTVAPAVLRVTTGVVYGFP